MKKQAKQERSKAIVDAVLEAATRILSKFRLKETSTNKIADTAGVGIGSLYDYFPNKNAIAVALIDKRVEKIVEDFEKLVTLSSGSLENLIDDSLEFITEDFLERRRFLREIFLLAPESQRMESLYVSRSKTVKILKDSLITKHAKNVLWAERKAFLLITAILGVLESYVMLEEHNFDPALLKQDLKKMMQTILEF